MTWKKEMIPYLERKGNKSMRRFGIAAFATVFVLCVLFAFTAVSAAKADIDYQGEIDPFSGEPVKTDSSVTENQTVALNGGIIFDAKTRMYSYAVSGGSYYINSSVPNGMVTTGSVKLEIPEEISAVIYRDGEPDEDIETSSIKQKGSYAVVVEDENSKQQILKFNIISERTGALNSYQLPDGFFISSVKIDNEQQKIVNRKVADLSKEGEYNITYRCEAIGVDYVLKISVDHTPPVLVLDGVENGKARNPVTVTGIEKSDNVKALYNEEKFSLKDGGVITSPGSYTITVTDNAGNAVTEKFVIEFYLNEQGWIFGLLIVVIAAATAVYMVMSRKRLRVR